MKNSVTEELRKEAARLREAEKTDRVVKTAQVITAITGLEALKRKLRKR